MKQQFKLSMDKFLKPKKWDWRAKSKENRRFLPPDKSGE
jgi:hypothetical protein